MYLTQGLRRCAQRQHDAPALLCDGRQLTWGEFESRVSRLAAAFVALGLQANDRVAMLSHNCSEYFEFSYAVIWAGGIVVPLNNKLAATELVYILNHSGARILIVDSDFSSLVTGFRDQLDSIECVVDVSPGNVDSEYERLITGTEPMSDQMRGYEDLAGIFYTSGTTGRPKGVMLSHRNLLWNAMVSIVNYKLTETTVYLHATPLFHAAGGSRIFSMVTAGTTNVILPKFDASKLLQAIADYGVTSLLLVPTMINRLVNEPSLADYDLSTLDTIAYGASPMPPSVLQSALTKLPHVQFCQAYGMTELSPTASFLERRYHVLDGPDAGRLSSCGQAVFGAEIRIVSDAGQTQAPGDTGEITVRGPMVMQGYWKNPQASHEAVRDGWMYTGDAGYCDDQGFIYIVDRIKDLVITGGVNVASVEVENCIYQLNDVAECAVFGVPHPDWVEAIHAVIVTKPGSCLSEQQVIEHCKKAMAVYKCPRTVTITEKPLPVSGSGKIMKNELRKPYWPHIK